MIFVDQMLSKSEKDDDDMNSDSKSDDD
jgi:hypothetical protein